MRLEKILVATDFSVGSERALEAALGLVDRDGGRITLFHVCQLPTYSTPDLGLYVPSPELVADVIRMARRQLDRLCARCDAVGCVVDAHWVVGTPADEIVRYAATGDYDLIVMGTHGRRGFRRLVLGSVAEKVVRNAHTPVLTVHDRDEVRAAPSATSPR